MKVLRALPSLVLPFLVLPLLAAPLGASAADDTKKETHRTTALGTCSKQAHAKGLKGDERKKFISGCVSAAKQAKPAAS
jgi:hypothetical protein